MAPCIFPCRGDLGVLSQAHDTQSNTEKHDFVLNLRSTQSADVRHCAFTALMVSKLHRLQYQMSREPRKTESQRWTRAELLAVTKSTGCWSGIWLVRPLGAITVILGRIWFESLKIWKMASLLCACSVVITLETNNVEKDTSPRSFRLHWPFLKSLGPAPLSRTRPGRENGDACGARWPACAHVHVSVGCGRAIEPSPTGLHYTCTACSWSTDRYRDSWQNTMKLNRSDDRRVDPALATGRCLSCSLSVTESLSKFLVHLHRNHERWTPGISQIVTS